MPTTRRRASRTLGLLAVSIAGIAATGCSATRSIDTSAARVFPPGLEQSRVLDVQVRRAPTTLAFTNTTASDIPACTMWLNKRYARPIEAVPVGQTVTYALADFVDEFGERFRPGGFWATRPSQRVVLAQFEIPDQAGSSTLLGTVVVNGEEDPDARRRRANPF